MLRSLTLSLLLATSAGALHADSKLMYDFETGTDGFKGKTSTSPTGATSGKSALMLDAKGSVAWNQSLALLEQNQDWSDAVEITMDVTVPPGTGHAAEFLDLIPVFSGPLNSWYALGKTKLVDGKVSVSVPMDGSKVGTPTKFYLVLNSGKPVPGPIYVDNIRKKSPGKPGTLKVQVKDASGGPVVGAIVAAGKEAVKTDGQGLATLNMPGDLYNAEVLGDGLLPVKFQANVPSSSSGSQVVTVQRKPKAAAKQARAKVMAGGPGLPFDAQRIYGHNMAMWNGLDPFTNPIQFQKLKAVRANMMRIPGGGYANQWNWKTGNVHKQDGSMAVDWKPEADWGVWKKWFQALGPQSEALIILNVFQSTPEEQVAWVRDAINSGIKVRYVELGNEPDLDPNLYFLGVKGASTHVDKFVDGVIPFAAAIRKNFPDIKILGPCPAQIVHRECPDMQPWLCQKTKNDFWMEKFLRLYAAKGGELDGISFHSYPYWPGEPAIWDPAKAFATSDLLKEYMPKWKGWMKQYYPKKAAQMEIALTEYHVQVPETYITADLESGVWHAKFLAEFIAQGGTIASGWDMNTHKIADGGGHGLLDPSGDPSRPYAERAKYWTYKMMANNFTGSLVQAQTDSKDVTVYATKDRGRVTVMLINSNPESQVQTSLWVAGAASATKVRMIRFSRKEFLWSKVLYRAVVNDDPTQKQVSFAAPAEKGGFRSLAPVLEPMSLNMFVFE